MDSCLMLTIFLLVVDGCIISKVFDTKKISSIIISFKYDSAILICISFWSDIGIILSPDSLGIAYQEKKPVTG